MTAGSAPRTLALSLVSHTNVGKTTLARTLLGRDIGEVRDAAHVTTEAARHLLIDTPQGDRLELWDTPGFGDSMRLARRLAEHGAVAWFMREVWDRFRDRGFYFTQLAIRNVRDDADVVLYLVNAAEDPADVAYLDPELAILAYVDKPVIVLLNQLGDLQSPAQAQAEVQRWKTRLAAAPGVTAVLALDAFSRCWVEEGALFRAVADAVPGSCRPAALRLQAAWQAMRERVWRESMQVLAERIAAAAVDTEPVEASVAVNVLDLGAVIGLRRRGHVTQREAAMKALAQRLDARVRTATQRLIALHGLEGEAAGAVLQRMAQHFAATEPADEKTAALWGGLVSGALAGLGADVASGGLTLGGGLLAGGVLGALGAAGLAKGYNMVRGVSQPSVGWSEEALFETTRSALLTYLTVAHYGRGRGRWAAYEQPGFWQQAVDELLQAERTALLELLRALRPDRGHVPDPAALARLEALLESLSRAALLKLHPHGVIDTPAAGRAAAG